MEEGKDIVTCFRFAKFFMKWLISNEFLYRQSKSLIDAIFAEHDYFCARLIVINRLRLSGDRCHLVYHIM